MKTSPALISSISVLALSALAAGCLPAAEEPAPVPAPAEMGDGYAEVDVPAPDPVVVPEGSPKVAVLGDSLAAGLHLPPDLAWPAELQRLLAAEGLPFELVNAGVSGDTSRGGLARLPWLLEKGAPDVVIVELGANDGLRGVDLAATEQNLREILTLVRESGASALLLGMNVPTNLGEYAEDFAALYPRLAEELEVPLVSFFLKDVGGVPEMNLADGMHPNVEGHRVLAGNVQEALRSLL
ncbi:MAG: arylesterase [Planctomycetota bacterium]